MTAIQEMPDHAKIWVYQSNRAFSPEERSFIEDQLTAFTSQWAAHGKQLLATYGIEKNQFIVLAVDESQHQASGCSIDSSVAVIRHIEQQTGLSLLDRSQVAFLENDLVKIKPFNQLKAAVANGEIRKDTEVFNNAIQNAGEWKASWIQPAVETWLSRYFG